VIPEALVRDVDLLCLDAGNTVVFFDHEAACEVARAAGFPVEPAALARAEGLTKRRLEQTTDGLLDPLPDGDIPAGWSAFIRTALGAAAGLDAAASAECTRALWRAHREYNLWRRLPPGLIDAVSELRRAGVPVCVVSNSEGKLHELFARLGIANAFDLVLDSHLVGIEKPDPRIFAHALSHFGTAPERALHLGDVFATDVVGARAAGLRAALVDPLGHYDGRHPDVPRVPDVAQTAAALRRARTRT
jgi:putative hydrolase of the HAD superfamily